MPRTRDESLVEQARDLASQGKTVTRIAAELGVDRRTVQRWCITAPPGRPRVSDEVASARTARRRRRELEMSETTGDRVALTKKLRDGRTAVVTVSAGGYGFGKYAIPTVTIDGQEDDRQSANVYDAPREVRSEHPELVAGVGPLLLTAEEAATLRAVMAEVQAALPPDLDGQRQRLVSALDGAGLEPGIRAAELMDAGDPDPFRDQAGLERRIMEASAALDAFDREHPEVAARAAARREATVRRVIENGPLIPGRATAPQGTTG